MSETRISVANIVHRVIVRETAEEHCVAVLASTPFKKGRVMWQAIGGAAELTDTGRQVLQDLFGAREFEKNDARFMVDSSQVNDVLDFFRERNQGYFETTAQREVFEELCEEELPGISAVLTHTEAETIGISHRGIYRQPVAEDGLGSSPVGKPTHRLFFLFDLIVSAEILQKMRQSKALRFLTESEVGTTKGGSSKGITEDGETIADNLFSQN